MERVNRKMVTQHIQRESSEYADDLHGSRSPGSSRRQDRLEYQPGAWYMATRTRPMPFSTVGRRNVTNVPGQSLALMNSPFVHGEATKWEQRLRNDGSATAQERIDKMWLTALGHQPTEKERVTALAFLKQQNGKPSMSDEELLRKGNWRELCHAILNLKEFIYIR